MRIKSVAAKLRPSDLTFMRRLVFKLRECHRKCTAPSEQSIIGHLVFAGLKSTVAAVAAMPKRALPPFAVAPPARDLLMMAVVTE